MQTIVGEPRPDGDYDPFGVHAAVAATSTTHPLPARVRARLEGWTLTIVAVLPVPLLVLTTVAAIVDWPNPPVTIAALLLWVWAVAFLAQQLHLFGKTAADLVVTTVPDARQRTSVLVIGAGPVGLAVVKECLAAGLDVECFERQDGLGGVFRFNEVLEGGVWESVRLTSSPWVTAFSDFPPDSPSFEHLHHSEYLEYLERYAEHFGLTTRIHYRHSVTRVTPDGDGWVVVVRDDQTSTVSSRRVDRVAVCAGTNRTPKSAELPGIEDFTGEIRHVAGYKGPAAFKGTRVVVAGAGESGVDVAAELSSVASETYLSIPRGKFVIPRINPENRVANDHDTTRIRYASPVALRNWFMLAKDRRHGTIRGRDPASAVRSQLLATSEAGPMSQTATKNDDFVAPVLDGRLRIRPRIVRFDGDAVVFADGTRQEADVVMFAHGYQPAFPFLELPDGVAHRHPGLLYLRMFIPELGDRIAFCGFARPAIGAIPPTGEIQARLFALVAAGQRSLPDRRRMQLSVLKTLGESADLYPRMTQPNVVISWIRYMDDLAAIIGCRPTVRLLRHPKLFWRVLRGPMTGAVYRLEGPGATRAARDTVLALRATHPLSEMITLTGLYFWTWPISLLHPSAAWNPHNRFL